MDSEDVNGVIGREAGKAVQRMPSSIYWAGLRRWNILIFEGSLAQYLRSLDRFYDSSKSHRSMLETDAEKRPEPMNWHPHLPSPPEGFPEGASLMLDSREAAYLRERILNTCSGTLLAYLVDRGERWKWTDFIWFHDLAAEFPNGISHGLAHARLFSEVMHGAARLYNVMLAEAQGREELTEKHRAAFGEWAEERHAQAQRLVTWDLRDFWTLVSASGARVTAPTRTFVTDWIERVRGSRHPRAAASESRCTGADSSARGTSKKEPSSAFEPSAPRAMEGRFRHESAGLSMGCKSTDFAGHHRRP